VIGVKDRACPRVRLRPPHLLVAGDDDPLAAGGDGIDGVERLQSMTRREYRCQTTTASSAAASRRATPPAPMSQAMWLASSFAESPSERSLRGMPRPA
jgi:hypothetical protein